MVQNVLEYLYKLLKDHKIAREHAQRRGDKSAVDNLDNKITYVEYLIDRTIKEL